MDVWLWHVRTWISGGLGCSGELLDSVILEVFSNLSGSKYVSWKNGDVREQGGQPGCHQEQHREPRKVSVSRNSFRIHFLLSHQWNFTVAEVSVLAGAEAGFPPAEDSSAHRSCWIAAQPCGNPAQLGCREAFSGWENGFVIAFLYNKHFKTCLLLLSVLVCTVLPETQRGVQTASRSMECCSAMENKADFAQKLWSSTLCPLEEWVVWCLMHRLNRGHPEGKAPAGRFWPKQG